MDIGQTLSRTIGPDTPILNYGNSIGAGYSNLFPARPLLSNLGIILYYNFSRCQGNDDAKILKYYACNTTTSQIDSLNRSDLNPNSETHIASLPKKAQQRPYKNPDSAGFRDLLLLNANSVVIINGFTGSFFDSITRRGAIRTKFLYGFRRDLHAIEAFCELTLNANRWNNNNIQIYVCGIPTFPPDIILKLLSHQIKNMAKRFPHVIYVESPRNSLIHRAKNRLYLDVHYSQGGYQKLEQKIVQTILDHFNTVKTVIQLDRSLSVQNDSAELSGKAPARMRGMIAGIKSLRAQAPHNYHLLN